MMRRGAQFVLGLLLFVSSASAASHVVQPGDTLWNISARTLGDGKRWGEIAALNRLAGPSDLRVGMTLALPEGVTATPPAPALRRGDSPRPVGSVAAAGVRGRVAPASPTEAPAASPDDDALPVADSDTAPSVAAPPSAPPAGAAPAWPESLRPALVPPPADIPSPLPLEAAVAAGLGRSPEVRAAAANLERIRGAVGVAFSYALPQVNVTGDLRRYETFRSNSIAALDATSRGGAVTVTQAIYNFGRIPHAIKAAKHEEAAALAAIADAASSTRLKIETAYLGVHLARERLSVAREALEVAAALKDRAVAREAAGVGTRFDVTRAEAEMAAALAAVVASQTEVDDAREELAVAMGLPAATALDPVGGLMTDERPPSPVPAARAEEMALASRPDLAMMEKRLASSRELTAFERSRGYPSIDAFANATYAHYDYINNASLYRGHENTTGYFGVMLTVPVFDGFRVRESVRTQQAVSDGLAAQFERGRLDAVREVRRLYNALGAALEALAARRAGAVAAQEAVRMAQVSFEAGRATSLDVIQASLTRANARRAEAEVVYQFRLGLARLVRAAGTDEVLRDGGIR